MTLGPIHFAIPILIVQTFSLFDMLLLQTTIPPLPEPDEEYA